MNCKVCGGQKFNTLTVENPMNTAESYNYSVCATCGFGTLIIQAQDMSSHYDENYDEYEKDVLSWTSKVARLFFEDRYDYVSNRIQKESVNKAFSVLDIGSGKGAYLAKFLETKAKLIGVDINKSALAYASKKYPHIKFLDTSNLADLKAEAPFAVISMWHVLEHIDDFSGYLKQIHSLLTLDGSFFVEVPNIRSLNLKIFGQKYQWISLPEHLNFFSTESLKISVEKAGFEVKDIYYPRLFPLLFASHFKNKYFRLLAMPVSVVIFLIAPYFNGTESVRLFCIKKKI